MDFGKLPSVDQVDFTLAPEPPQNTSLWQGLPPRQAAPVLYLGATGYNMKPWVGRWYPAGTKDKEHLLHYGRQFNTIEHNTTHYRIPDAATVMRWREEVPADFRYCPKIPQTISHARDLGLSGRDIGLFCTAIRGLEERLGCCFLQLPPQFDVTRLPALARFLEVFPADIPLAVEVRHESFFVPSVAAEDYFRLLQASGRATVITDVAGRRDVCHLRLTSGTVLIRFVGNGLHASDYTRIQDWAGRLQDWYAAGLRETYFFCHEPDNLLAPDLAAYAAGVFGQGLAGVGLRGPEALPTPPQQGSLF
ncbi:MAG: DUF72 domain-containing protein [Saprospiraceae bacterium]|nr:DUF72 domain-containing protein [Saprospiraceae bacterium]